MNKWHSKMMMNSTQTGVGRPVTADHRHGAAFGHDKKGLTMHALSRMILLALLTMGLAAGSALAAAIDGRIVYSINTTTPQHRTYANGTNTFGAAANTIVGAIPTFMVNKRAPNRNERMVGYISGLNLYIMRYDGTTWTNEWNVAVIGAASINGRRFDIEYEQSSSRCMVVYSRNNTTNEMVYRIWDGIAWTAATNYIAPTTTTGIINDIKLEAQPNSNNLAVGAVDMNNDLAVLKWNGSAWGNEPAAVLENGMYQSVAVSDTVNFDLAFESLSGDLFVAWHGTNKAVAENVYYNTLSSTGTWGTTTALSGTARTGIMAVDVAADPLSDKVVAVWERGASLNLYGTIWDGTNLAAASTIGTNNTTPAVNKKRIAAGWVVDGTTSACVVAYTSTVATNNVSYAYYTTAWTPTLSDATGVTRPAIGAWLDADVYNNEMILAFSDANSDLFVKRLTFTAPATFDWVNADGGAALTATLTNNTTQNFDFSYDQIVDSTPPTEGTLSVTPQSGTFVPGTFTITETFTEAQSKVSSCEYTLDDTLWSAGAVSGAVSPYTCTASNVTAANGASLTIKMRATSKGGTSTPSNTLTRTVDALAPVTTDSYPGGSVTVDQSITLSVTDGAGVGGTTTKWCQDTTNTCDPSVGTTGLGPIAVTGAAGAKTTKYIRYFSTDAVSNAEAVKSTAIVIDKRDLTEPLAIQFTNVGYYGMTVRVLFGGDLNANNNCTVTWGTDGVTYGNSLAVTRSTGVYTGTIGSLTPGTLYYFKAVFGDADTVSPSAALLNSQATNKILLLHNSVSNGPKYPTWGANYTCETCHQPDAPNIKRLRATVGGSGLTNSAGTVVSGNAMSASIAGGASANYADNATTNKVCDTCHGSTQIYKRGVNNATSGTPVMITGASPPHPADVDCIKCHLHNVGFKVKAGCIDCHNVGGTYQVATAAPTVVNTDGVTALRGEIHGGHLRLTKNEDLSLVTDWNARCLACHDGHVNTNGVHIDENPNVGINYLRPYIALGGTATSGSTEAEICWNCHDQNGDGDLNDAGDISEWGTNTYASTGNSAYNYGTLSTSNWTSAAWTSGKAPDFSYKTGAIQSTHTAKPGVTDTLSGSDYNFSEAKNAVADIRCTYCHDVHNTASLTAGYTGDVNGKPYLRGTWVGNLYPEDGAPQSGQTAWLYEGGTSGYGHVPRGSASSTNTGTTGVANLGGYWIDQNSGNPISAIAGATNLDKLNNSAGLCERCHNGAASGNGTWTTAEINSIDSLDAANRWVSGASGHNNSVLGAAGSTATAVNIFSRTRRGSAVMVPADSNANATAGNPYADMGYATDAGRGWSYRGNITDSTTSFTYRFYPRIGGATINTITPGATTSTAGATEPQAMQYFAWGNFANTGGDWTAWLATAAHRYATGTASLNVGGLTQAITTGTNTESGTALAQANYHTFTCSKCHNPHASRLPKLMITNCLDTSHNTWQDDYQAATYVPGTYLDLPTTDGTAPDRKLSGSPWAGTKISQWPTAQNCHRLDIRGSNATPNTTLGTGWNKVTPW